MLGNGRKVAVQTVVGKHFIHSISEEVFSQEVSLNTENKLVAGAHGNVIGRLRLMLVQFKSWP